MLCVKRLFNYSFLNESLFTLNNTQKRKHKSLKIKLEIMGGPVRWRGTFKVDNESRLCVQIVLGIKVGI